MDDPATTGAAPPIADPADGYDGWDAATPGVLAFRLAQARLRYADLTAELRTANIRAALLLAAGAVSAPLAIGLAFAPLPAWFDGRDLWVASVAGAHLLALVFLLGALLDLARALSSSAPASPYRMEELGYPERYVTPGDRTVFTSSLAVLQHRQIQRLRPAVRELETEIAHRHQRLRRGVGQLVTGLVLEFLTALAVRFGPGLWPG